jgi:hypothetical protein
MSQELSTSEKNSLAKLFLLENMLIFQNWYHPDIVQHLLQMANNEAKCIRVVFFDADEGNNTKTFNNQLAKLVMLGNLLGKPVLFISKEPGADNHFICGIIKDSDLLLINPLGITSHEACFQTLAELRKEGTINNIWLSSNCLQQERFEDEGLVSCGPVTLELAIHLLSNYTPEELLCFWAKNLKMDGSTLHHTSGLVYYGINIKSLLPDTLAQLENSFGKKEYQAKICKIRQNHYNYLRTCPNDIKESPDQIIFAKLVTDESINIDKIQLHDEFKLLKENLNQHDTNLNILRHEVSGASSKNDEKIDEKSEKILFQKKHKIDENNSPILPKSVKLKPYASKLLNKLSLLRFLKINKEEFHIVSIDTNSSPTQAFGEIIQSLFENNNFDVKEYLSAKLFSEWEKHYEDYEKLKTQIDQNKNSSKRQFFSFSNPSKQVENFEKKLDDVKFNLRKFYESPAIYEWYIDFNLSLYTKISKTVNTLKESNELTDKMLETFLTVVKQLDEKKKLSLLESNIELAFNVLKEYPELIYLFSPILQKNVYTKLLLDTSQSGQKSVEKILKIQSSELIVDENSSIILVKNIDDITNLDTLINKIYEANRENLVFSYYQAPIIKLIDEFLNGIEKGLTKAQKDFFHNLRSNLVNKKYGEINILQIINLEFGKQNSKEFFANRWFRFSKAKQVKECVVKIYELILAHKLSDKDIVSNIDTCKGFALSDNISQAHKIEIESDIRKGFFQYPIAFKSGLDNNFYDENINNLAAVYNFVVSKLKFHTLEQTFVLKKLEAVYQEALIKKGLTQENLNTLTHTNMFDTQMRVITRVVLTEVECHNILSQVGIKCQNTAKATLQKFLDTDLDKPTLCSLNIVDQQELEKAYKKWLSAPFKKSQKIDKKRFSTVTESPDNLSSQTQKLDEDLINNFLKFNGHSSIIPLYEEMYFYSILSLEIFKKISKNNEDFGLTDEVGEKIHVKISDRLNTKCQQVFLKALQDCYENNHFNLILLNERLNEERINLANESEILFLTVIKEVVNDSDKFNILKEIFINNITLKTYRETPATGSDYLRTDTLSESAMRVSATPDTAHNKQLGAANTAYRPIHRTHYKNNHNMPLCHFVIDARIPSIAIPEVYHWEAVNDVNSKLAHLHRKLQQALPYAKDQSAIYFLLTSLHNKGKAIFDGSNAQRSSAARILKGSHLYNRTKILKGKIHELFFIQNIPVNQHTKELTDKTYEKCVKEAALMADIALLHTLYQYTTHFSENIKNKLASVYSEINQLYRNFLINPNYNKVDNESRIGNLYFHETDEGETAVGKVTSFKETFKNESLSQMNINLIEPQINKNNQNGIVTHLISLVLLKMLLNDTYRKKEYGMLVQSLSVFLTTASIVGCKSGNDRYESVVGRVHILHALNNKLENFLPAEQVLLDSLKDFIRYKKSNPDEIQKNLDILYNDHYLYTNHTFSLEDTGGPRKLIATTERSTQLGSLDINTNIAESGYLKNLKQSTAAQLQSHKRANPAETFRETINKLATMPIVVIEDKNEELNKILFIQYLLKIASTKQFNKKNSEDLPFFWVNSENDINQFYANLKLNILNLQENTNTESFAPNFIQIIESLQLDYSSLSESQDSSKLKIFLENVEKIRGWLQEIHLSSIKEKNSAEELNKILETISELEKITGDLNNEPDIITKIHPDIKKILSESAKLTKKTYNIQDILRKLKNLWRSEKSRLPLVFITPDIAENILLNPNIIQALKKLYIKNLKNFFSNQTHTLIASFEITEYLYKIAVILKKKLPLDFFENNCLYEAFIKNDLLDLSAIQTTHFPMYELKNIFSHMVVNGQEKEIGKALAFWGIKNSNPDYLHFFLDRNILLESEIVKQAKMCERYANVAAISNAIHKLTDKRIKFILKYSENIITDKKDLILNLLDCSLGNYIDKVTERYLQEQGEEITTLERNRIRHTYSKNLKVLFHDRDEMLKKIQTIVYIDKGKKIDRLKELVVNTHDNDLQIQINLLSSKSEIAFLKGDLKEIIHLTMTLSGDIFDMITKNQIKIKSQEQKFMASKMQAFNQSRLTTVCPEFMTQEAFTALLFNTNLNPLDEKPSSNKQLFIVLLSHYRKLKKDSKERISYKKWVFKIIEVMMDNTLWKESLERYIKNNSPEIDPDIYMFLISKYNYDLKSIISNSDKNGNTLLHYTLEEKYYLLASILIEDYEADLTRKNAQQIAAFQFITDDFETPTDAQNDFFKVVFKIAFSPENDRKASKFQLSVRQILDEILKNVESPRAEMSALSKKFNEFLISNLLIMINYVKLYIAFSNLDNNDAHFIKWWDNFCRDVNNDSNKNKIIMKQALEYEGLSDRINEERSKAMSKEGYGVGLEKFTILSNNLTISYYASHLMFKSCTKDNFEGINQFLIKEAKQFGFICSAIKRDGNCMFSAISKQLINTGNPYNPRELRKIAVNYIKLHKEYYEPFIVNKNFDDYIHTMAQLNTWGDHNILNALCHLLKINIVVINSDATKPVVMKKEQAIATIYLGYEVGMHYHSLQRDNKIYPQKDIEIIVREADFLKEGERVLSESVKFGV